MLGAARNQVRPLARVVAAPFLWLRIPPTAITVAALAPAAVGAYYTWRQEWFLAVGFGVASGFLDMADGAVARIQDRVTTFGGFLDSVVDRVVDLVFLFAIGFALDTPTTWALVGVGVLGSYGTSYARARVYEDARPPRDAWHQFFERPERAILIGLGVLVQGILEAAGRDPDHYALTGMLAMYGLATVATFLQRIWVARRLLRAAAP